MYETLVEKSTMIMMLECTKCLIFLVSD